MTKILLADDHAALRIGLRYLLHRAFPNSTVIEACNYTEAYALARHHHDLDLVILDRAMPGNDPADGIATLRSWLPTTSIMIFSASDDPQDRIDASAAGADTYLHKSVTSEEIILEIRRSLHRSVPNHCPQNHETECEKTQAQKLTRRQQQVLALLVQGMTNKQIGRALQISDLTVKTHVTTIFHALSATTRTEAARYAVRDGHLSIDD